MSRVERDRLTVAERDYRRLWDTAVEGLYRNTLDGAPVDANPAMARMLGYASVQELLAEVGNVGDLYVDPASRERVVAALLTDGEMHDLEAEYRRADGDTVWLAISGRIVHDPDGRPVGIEGMAVDITDRKRADRQLARREQMLAAVSRTAELLLTAPSWESAIDEILAGVGRAADASRCALLVNTVHDGVRVTSRSHVWTLDGVDPLAEDPRVAALPYEQMGLGRWAMELTAGRPIDGPADAFPAAEQPALDALGVQTLAIAPIHVDGAWWGALAVDDLRDSEPWSSAEVGVLMAAARLVGGTIEQQQSRATLAQYAADLERSNQELEQFAYVASHDLQEPLRMVTSFLTLLQRRYEGALDEKADSYIHFAVDGASRMQHLISDLLDYSRVTTRGEEPRAVDANDVVARVLNQLGPAIDDAGARVEVGDLPVVSVDETQLGQVVQNLISNALKFHGDASPEVHVSACRADDGWWEFAVSDNGIGIAEEHVDRIFVLFRRLHTRDEYPGTGIGLAICKKIVERHGGRLWVVSTPGAGASFRFTLPPGSPKPSGHAS